MKAIALLTLFMTFSGLALAGELNAPLGQIPSSCLKSVTDIQKNGSRAAFVNFPFSRQQRNKDFILSAKAQAEAAASDYWLENIGTPVSSITSLVKKMRLNSGQAPGLGAYVEVNLNQVESELKFEFYFINSEEQPDTAFLTMAELTDFRAMPGESPGVLWFCKESF